MSSVTTQERLAQQDTTFSFPDTPSELINDLKVPASAFPTRAGIEQAMERFWPGENNGLTVDRSTGEITHAESREHHLRRGVKVVDPGVGIREGPRFFVSLGPGIMRLASRDLAKSERSREKERRRHEIDIDLEVSQLINDGSSAQIIREWRGDGTVEVHRIKSWSKKSRTRMLATIMAIDFRSMFKQGLPCMTTLTYPGHWADFAPDADTSKGHFRSWVKRYERRWGFRPANMWKLEFQHRGAAHYHILMPLPKGVSAREFREWVGLSWNQIIESEALNAALAEGCSEDVLTAIRHDAKVARTSRRNGDTVGTQVDIAEGLRCRDPKRIAIYFWKHASKTSDSKEYQHDVPALWQVDGPGRFWGTMGLDVVRVEREITAEEFVQLRRVLRRYSKGKLFQSSRLTGGWVAVNDGPEFLSILAKWLATLVPEV